MVRDESGKPVANARVALLFRPVPLIPTAPLPAPAKPHNATAVTGADGRFSFAGVPEGVYVLSPSLAKDDYLDSCTWYGDKGIVPVRTGQPATANLVLRKGHWFRVRLNDAGRRLPALDARPGEKMRVFIGGPGTGPIAMPVSAVQAAAREHSILVPYDMDLTVRLSSRTFQITDAGNAALDVANGRNIAVRVAKGNPAAPLVLNVVGVQAGAK